MKIYETTHANGFPCVVFDDAHGKFRRLYRADFSVQPPSLWVELDENNRFAIDRERARWLAEQLLAFADGQTL